MTQPGTRPDRRQNPGAPAVGLRPGPGIHRRGVLAAVSLPDGRALAVRTVTEADAEGLHALFEGLSDDDRHHRFFNLCHPDRKFPRVAIDAAQPARRTIETLPSRRNAVGLLGQAGAGCP